MELVFLYGPVASGKYTIGRALAERTGLPLFHNHLIVDAVAAVFPFGSPEFVKLRERLWRDVIGEAARSGRSLIFTFAPEPTVDDGFAERIRALVEGEGGRVIFVALEVAEHEQLRRAVEPDRAAFGKLRSAELLAQLRDGLERSLAAMPAPALAIDTMAAPPDAAAARIAEYLAEAQ